MQSEIERLSRHWFRLLLPWRLVFEQWSMLLADVLQKNLLLSVIWRNKLKSDGCREDHDRSFHADSEQGILGVAFEVGCFRTDK